VRFGLQSHPVPPDTAKNGAISADPTRSPYLSISAWNLPNMAHPRAIRAPNLAPGHPSNAA